MRWRMSGLAAHLAALAAAVLLPALGVGAAAVWTAVQGQRAAFEEGLRNTARALALVIDTEITGVTAALVAFTTSPAFGPDPAEPNLPLLDAHARRIAQQLDVAFYVAKEDGTRLLTTRLPFGAPLPPVAGRKLVERVFATGRPVVGNLTHGSLSGTPTVAIGVPIRDDHGRVVLMAGASIEVTRLRNLLERQVREPTFATLVDGNHMIIARSRDQEASIGKKLLPQFIERLEGRSTGFYVGPNQFGDGSVGVYSRLAAASGWLVILGEPVAVYRNAAWRPVRALVIGGTLTAALALLVALAIGRRILRPVAALRRRAEAVAESGGHEAVPPDVPSKIAEFEELRQAVVRAAATLRAERDRALLYFDVAEAMLLVLAPDGSVRDINRRGLAVLALDREEQAVGSDWFTTFIPERWRETMRGKFDEIASGENRTFETYEKPVLRADGAERLVRWRNAVLRDDSGALVAVVASGEDITEARAAEERQRLLAREVDHRAKNALAVVQSILHLTPAEDPQAFRAAVGARVAALARAHVLLAEEGWFAADLHTLLVAEVSPHTAAAGGVRLSGPPVEIAAVAVQPLAMLAHELATNAAKHGALSLLGGTVEVRWIVEPMGSAEVLHIRWAESGGPPVHGAPARKGFGTRVIETTVRGQLGGTVSRKWEPTGLVVEVLVPLARVLADRGARQKIGVKSVGAAAAANTQSGERTVCPGSSAPKSRKASQGGR